MYDIFKVKIIRLTIWHIHIYKYRYDVIDIVVYQWYMLTSKRCEFATSALGQHSPGSAVRSTSAGSADECWRLRMLPQIARPQVPFGLIRPFPKGFASAQLRGSLTLKEEKVLARIYLAELQNGWWPGTMFALVSHSSSQSYCLGSLFMSFIYIYLLLAHVRLAASHYGFFAQRISKKDSPILSPDRWIATGNSRNPPMPWIEGLESMGHHRFPSFSQGFPTVFPWVSPWTRKK